MAGPEAPDRGDLAAPFAGLPAALQALQDRAVAAAVEQAAALLRDHYALYHRTTAGGGAWVALAAHTVPAGSGEASIDFSGISQDYTTLVAIGDNLHTGTTQVPVCFQLNAWDGNDYLETVHRHGSTTTHGLVFPTANNAGSIGYAPPGDDDDLDDVGAFTLWLPGYVVTGRYKNYYGQASLAGEDGKAYGYEVAGLARLGFAAHEDVDQLTFYAGYTSGGSPVDVFRPGSRISLYGVGGP